MPIRWMEDDREPTFNVIQFPPGEPVLIVAGSDKSFDRSHLLHWLPDHRRAVPCTHEDCPWCPGPKRSVRYVPALQILAGRWYQRILPLTDGMLRFIDENRAKVVWEFRRGSYHNAQVKWHPCISFKLQVPEFAGFNVENSLLRMWGQWSEMKRRARPEVV